MIEPSPPVADIALPWDAELADPVAAIAATRAALGDTFVVPSPDGPFLFLFSPEGVREFYALPEDRASKGIADWRMLRRKLPDELFDGRRTMPHELFGRAGTSAYLAQLDRALDVELDALGTAGTLDVFAFTRRLGHRMGLGAWGGEASATGERFDRLVPALDALDGSDAFVHPEAMAEVARTGKQAERAALAVSDELLGASVSERLAAGPEDDLFQQIVDRWPDDPTGAARDVVLVHLASMSNLFAALAWAIVDLLAHPEVDVTTDPGLAERCALESTRLAQRSIMLRYVHQPVEVLGHSVQPGATIATLLPLTNLDSAPGLDRWDPERWKGRRLRGTEALAAVELVTAFGHGSHTCPAQPFSLAAMTRTVTRLLTTFDLAPTYDRVEPLPVQIGGVARAAGPAPVDYRRR